MRDLDQLRERGEEANGRKLGLFVLAGLVSVAAIFAMSAMMGGGDEGEKAPPDPLAELVASTEQGAAAPAKPADVKPESLSFPSTLLDREDAMLEATIRAAEEEHAELSGSPKPRLPSLPTPSVADLPAASLATDDNARLSRVAKHDPLVAEALPTRAGPAAPEGHEGAYTLQVVSYDNRPEAEQFASTLRARGHKAFVSQADVPERGRFFRVRIGPFDTRQEAVSYQDSFETDEHMHTILVSNGAN